MNYWNDNSEYTPKIILNIVKALKSNNAWEMKTCGGLPKRPLKKSVLGWITSKIGQDREESGKRQKVPEERERVRGGLQ